MSSSGRPKPKRPPPPRLLESNPLNTKSKNGGFNLEQGNPLFFDDHETVEDDLFDEKPLISSDTPLNHFDQNPMAYDSFSSDDELFPVKENPMSELNTSAASEDIGNDSVDLIEEESHLMVEDHYSSKEPASQITEEVPPLDPVPHPTHPDPDNRDVLSSSEQPVPMQYTSAPVQAPLIVGSAPTVGGMDRALGSHSSSRSPPVQEEPDKETVPELDPGPIEATDVILAMEADFQQSPQGRDIEAPLLGWGDIFCLALVIYFYQSFMFLPYIAGFVMGMYVLLILLCCLIGFLSYYQVIKSRMHQQKANTDSDTNKVQLEKLFDLKLDTIAPMQEDFMLGYSYDTSLRTPTRTHPVRLTLKEFLLKIETDRTTIPESNLLAYQFWEVGEDKVIQEKNSIAKEFDLRNCHISLTPEEVARDRKRRWSKKYPVRLHVRLPGGPDQKGVVYLFAVVARYKEDWYRQMDMACKSISVEDRLKKLRSFLSHMSRGIPGLQQRTQSSAKPKVPKRPPRPAIQLSRLTSEDQPDPNWRDNHIEKAEEATDGNVLRPQKVPTSSPSQSSSGQLSYQSRKNELQTKPVRPPQPARPLDQSPAMLKRQTSAASVSSQSSAVASGISLDWVNALGARVGWDVLNEERWRKWVMERIDKKLKRLQRPSFLEELHLTDVKLGSDVPVIKRINREPMVNQRGVWIYVEVAYKGEFTMTIQTKLKPNTTDVADENGRGLPSSEAKAVAFSVQSLEKDEQGASDSDDETALTINKPKAASDKPSTTTSKKMGRLKNYVSTAVKAAANTRLGRQVTDKMATYPLILKVKVMRLEGPLVINIPPPPSDSIWYGFERRPYLLLSAKPRLFNRDVTLSYVTDWIEKRLVELVEKKVVKPNMLDLTAKPLNSGFPEDFKET